MDLSEFTLLTRPSVLCFVRNGSSVASIVNLLYDLIVELGIQTFSSKYMKMKTDHVPTFTRSVQVANLEFVGDT